MLPLPPVTTSWLRSPKSGDNVTKIVITLKGDGWKNAADADQTVTITITGVTSAIPRSLYVPDTGYPYREYTFTTRSMAKGGGFATLRIPEATGDDPQPKLRVGNVKSGKGKVGISPVVYQGETDRPIQLIFTAAGPMYDSADGVLDSSIAIIIPTGLGSAADPFPAPMPQIDAANGDEFISVSRVTGTVRFANPNQRILLDPNNTPTVTIDITRMEYNAKIYVSYRKVDVDPGLDDADNFGVTSVSGTNDAVAVTLDPDGTTGKEHVRLIAGSGAIKITSSDIVPMDTRQNITFTYTAVVKLVDATLVISQPDNVDPTWSVLTLVGGSDNAREDNYVTVSGDHALSLTTNLGAITVSSIDLDKNRSFTVGITRATLATTPADDDADPVPSPAGAYGWGTTLAPKDGDAAAVTEPKLYIVNVNDDVEFDVLNDAGEVDDASHYHAAEERNIYFQFGIMTPIKEGSLQFNIPPTATGWRQPSVTAAKGKATVRLVERDAAGNLLTLNAAGEKEIAEDLSEAILTTKYLDNEIKTSGNRITVTIKALEATTVAHRLVTIKYGDGTGDMQGMVQRKAEDDLEIIGRFSTGVSGTLYPADSPVLMRIGNVEAGSGTAMITSPSSHTVKAGSEKNTIKIVYRAAGNNE